MKGKLVKGKGSRKVFPHFVDLADIKQCLLITLLILKLLEEWEVLLMLNHCIGVITESLITPRNHLTHRYHNGEALGSECIDNERFHMKTKLCCLRIVAFGKGFLTGCADSEHFEPLLLLLSLPSELMIRTVKIVEDQKAIFDMLEVGWRRP